MKNLNTLLVVLLFSQFMFAQKNKNAKIYYDVECYTLASERMDSIASTLFTFVSEDLNKDSVLIADIENSGFIPSDITVYETKLFECKFLVNTNDTIEINSSEESNMKFLDYLIKNKASPYGKMNKILIKIKITYGVKYILISDYEIKLSNNNFLIISRNNNFRIQN